ncbi:MAG: hypothetical protein JHC82_14540 [Stenotrophomonas sp.]|jgi:hypothetical protein|nr:hypothetical protein [Stenotrophomonas sp.]
MIKTLAATLLLSFASFSAHAASWRCDFIYDGDIADTHFVEADSEEQAMQRVREWAAGEHFLIDDFIGCRAV